MSHPTSRPLVAAATANAAAGTLFAWSVLLPSLSAELGRSATDLGVVFSVGLAVFAAAVLLAGPVADRQGPRRVLAAGGLLSAAGLAVGATAGDLSTLLLGIGVLFGSGSGLTYLGTVSWATTRTGSRRAWAVATVVASYAAGPVAAGPLGSLAADRWGARTTLLGAALVVGGVIGVASRGLPGPPTTAPATGRGAGPVGDTTGLAALWVFAVAAFAPGLLGFAYAADMATTQGVSSGGAGLVVALMAVANLAGRLLAAPLLTGAGLTPALMTVVGVLGVALLTLALVPGTPGTLVGLSALGGQYGLTSALLPVATREVCAEARFGTAYGRVFTAWGVAGLVGPATGAALYAASDGYARGFAAWLGGAAVAAVALVVYGRRRSARDAGRTRPAPG